MPWKLFDFIDHRGRNVISDWISSQQRDHQGRIKVKLLTLVMAGSELPPKLLTPTRERSVLEICIKTNVSFRLLVCRGPLNVNKEFTLLYGCKERDRKYVPANAPEIAERHRQQLIVDIATRRCEHEHFKEFLG